ncbi:hypothetical protein AX16_010942 [Volvariella volvacea WC 439]|nr:hypothetical protein AX16_010942 [Volvariella volvacea WC 439]
MPSVLFVFTSADKTLRNKPTGWYLPEAAHPYYVLSPHVSIDFAAPKGANPPLDLASVEAFANDEECTQFLNDDVVKAKLANAKKLSDVNANHYDAILYIGGHAPVIDLPEDPVNIKLASQFWQSGKIVSAVCHGTAALAGVTDSAGKSIFDGRSFTGFSNAEDEAIGAVEDIPFLLEDKLTALGGKYEKADNLWGAKVVVDGKLLTGQNPASATPLGQAILKALSA